MQLIGLARLGKDTELRYTKDGKAVASLSLAFNYGLKDKDGERPTQWVDASLWNDRATKLTQYLTKGTLLFVQLDDVHVETYTKKDGGTGTSLRAMVGKLEFAGGKRDSEEKPAAAQPAKETAPKDDFEDDIPF